MRGLERGVERAIAILRLLYGDEKTQGWDYSGEGIFKTIAHVEIESFVALNLVKQMEQGVVAPAPVFTDVKTFPFELFRDRVCVLTGGYPCQPFSQAGKQRSTEDPRHLFPFIIRGVRATRPVLCWFENVANHLNLGYDYVRGALQEAGYTVKEGIFSAAQVGAPHIRKRLFILAVANTYCDEHAKERGDLAKVLGIPKAKRQSKHGAFVSGRNGESMGNSYGEGQQQPERSLGKIGGWAEYPGKNVDHSFYAGLERLYWDGNDKARWQESVRSIASTSLWPAGQGTYQHEWEEPRLESGVGVTIDGFDFTEDLLRLAGNAVVEQQSQIAFLTLLRQFL